MIKINKKERDWLISKGVRCGTNGISRTYNHSKHWFLCESVDNMKLINSFRNSNIVR